MSVIYAIIIMMLSTEYVVQPSYCVYHYYYTCVKKHENNSLCYI